MHPKKGWKSRFDAACGRADTTNESEGKETRAKETLIAALLGHTMNVKALLRLP